MQRVDTDIKVHWRFYNKEKQPQEAIWKSLYLEYLHVMKNMQERTRLPPLEKREMRCTVLSPEYFFLFIILNSHCPLERRHQLSLVFPELQHGDLISPFFPSGLTCPTSTLERQPPEYKLR